MNPHFVFNAMNSIQNFVIDNKTDDALWYMGEFSKLMRQTLDFSSRSFIHLEEELDYLKRYIDLENLRRKVKVDCVMLVPENLDAYEIQIPPLLIEPIIENVFVHAFDEKMQVPQIKIEFQLLDNHLACKITDNGRGIESTSFMQKKHSKGLYLIEERIRLISKSDLEMVKISKNAEGGTTVTLLIPLR
jgi:LytS/YehU family sensor histidine kinase